LLKIVQILCTGGSKQQNRYDRTIFAAVEDWQLDFEWLRVQHHVKDMLKRADIPDLQGVLFLIGLQELGMVKKQFTKEQKQDLMHIAVCTLLSSDGYYTFQGLDADGWPHFKQERPVPTEGVQGQERLLKEKIIQYFNLEQHEVPTENGSTHHV
jgi:hypothetical protein